MPDPCTVPPLRVSVGNGETQYYFSHQQRDVLSARGWDGWWWGGCQRVQVFASHHGSIAAMTEWKSKRSGTWKHQRGAMLLLLRHLQTRWMACSPSSAHNDFTRRYKTNTPSLALNWINFIIKSFHFHLPGRWRLTTPHNTTHTAWLHPVPSTLSSYGAEWLVHCATPLTRNPFTALNRCPCPPPPPPPLSIATPPPSCPSPPEDDKSPSAP